MVLIPDVLTFGRYRILHRIASGGMAEVYRAVAVGEGGFQKEVVLKRIRPELAADPRFGAMFVEEAKLAATLTHANIVQVLDLGRVDGEYFLALESIRGRDLRQVLDQHRAEGTLMPLELALLVAVDVARALDYAHRRRDRDGRPLGLIHRDLSPHNVLLSFEGEVKLADFGVAKVLGRGVTERGALKGKIAYMSPEQARTDEIDQRSDLYALGILVQELTTGAHPFAGGGDLEVLDRVQRGAAAPPARPGAPLPAPLSAFLGRALEPDRAGRFQTAADALRALEAVVGAEPARATASDLAAYMRGRFPYEVPVPVIALDHLIEEELRADGDAGEDGLARFTAVTVRAEPGAGGGARGAAAAAPRAQAPVAGAAGARVRVVALVLGLAATAGAVAVALTRPHGAPRPVVATPVMPASHPVVAVPPSSAVAPPAPAGVAPPASAVVAPAPPRPLPPRVARPRPPASPAGRGFARFRTEPAYAEVWIAGTRRCNTPCTVELPAGTYAVRLVNPTLHREAARTVVVTPEHTRERPADVAVPGFR